MTAAVSSAQRHTRAHRCIVCDGADGDTRGQQKRCSGFTSSDGKYIHCSREEFAGAIEQNRALLFAHLANGKCKCGKIHGSGDSRPASDTVEAAYDYRDEKKVLLFQVVRKTGKKFLQRRPDGAGGWQWKVGDVRRVLYRLPALLIAPADKPVFVVEGEKDVDTLWRLGHVATCNPGGAGKWRFVADHAREVLRDRTVIVVADTDDVGRKHASEVAASLRGIARSVDMREPPAGSKDVTDLVLSGGDVAALIAPAAKPENDVTSTRAAYVIESAAELATPLPPLTWLCQGLRLAKSSITLIGGYGYSRKTLYAQSLALSVASGSQALGVYGVTQTNVVHVDYEQGQRITRERYQRLARAGGMDLRSAKLSVVTFPRFRISDKDARETFRRLLEETKAGLVVIDSLRASVTNVDENSSEIREHIDLVGQECKRVDAAAIFIHHARKPSEGKAGGKYSLRGSSAIFDAVDGVFVFSGEKGEPTMVEHEKDRLVGVELESFGLDSEDVAEKDDPRWGLRLVHLEPEQMRERDAAGRAEVDALETASRITRVQTYLSSLPANTWKGTRSDLAKQVGGRKATTMATLGDLVSTGRLFEVRRGKNVEAIRWVGP